METVNTETLRSIRSFIQAYTDAVQTDGTNCLSSWIKQSFKRGRRTKTPRISKMMRIREQKAVWSQCLDELEKHNERDVYAAVLKLEESEARCLIGAIRGISKGMISKDNADSKLRVKNILRHAAYAREMRLQAMAH